LLKKSPPRTGGGQIMFPSLDIFKIEGADVLWRDAVADLEEAKTRIRRLALSSPGEYFVFNQHTGQRTAVTQLLGYAQNECPSVESGDHGPRVGMG